MRKIKKDLLLSLEIIIIFDQQIFHDDHIYLVHCRIASTALGLKLQALLSYSNISLKNNSNYLVVNLI